MFCIITSRPETRYLHVSFLERKSADDHRAAYAKCMEKVADGLNKKETIEVNFQGFPCASSSPTKEPLMSAVVQSSVNAMGMRIMQVEDEKNRLRLCMFMESCLNKQLSKMLGYPDDFSLDDIY